MMLQTMFIIRPSRARTQSQAETYLLNGLAPVLVERSPVRMKACCLMPSS